MKLLVFIKGYSMVLKRLSFNNCFKIDVSPGRVQTEKVDKLPNQEKNHKSHEWKYVFNWNALSNPNPM